MSRALKLIDSLLSELELELKSCSKTFGKCIRFREGQDDLSITKKYSVLNSSMIHAKYHFEKRKDIDKLQPSDYINLIESFHNKYRIIHPYCKLLLLIRHGAAQHNITANNKSQTKPTNIKNGNINTSNIDRKQDDKKHTSSQKKAIDKTIIDMFDPILTDQGKDQCLQLSNYFKEIGNTVDLVVISPLTRTIETATLAILPHITQKSIVNNTIVVEFAREIMNGSDCTKRRSLNQIKTMFDNKYGFTYFGFDNKDNIDSTFDSENRETPKELRKRAEYFLDWLMNDRTETIIAYSGHSGMILAILQIIQGVKPYYAINGACIPLVLSKKL